MVSDETAGGIPRRRGFERRSPDRGSQSQSDRHHIIELEDAYLRDKRQIDGREDMNPSSLIIRTVCATINRQFSSESHPHSPRKSNPTSPITIYISHNSLSDSTNTSQPWYSSKVVYNSPRDQFGDYFIHEKSGGSSLGKTLRRIFCLGYLEE